MYQVFVPREVFLLFTENSPNVAISPEKSKKKKNCFPNKKLKERKYQKEEITLPNFSKLQTLFEKIKFFEYSLPCANYVTLAKTLKYGFKRNVT
jgi:hypothetical protein